MDELGDWVYIILMVVVGISSFVGSINKKKRQQQSQMPLPETSEPEYPSPYVPEQKERKQPPAVPGNYQHQPLDAHQTFPTDEIDAQTETYLMQAEESSLANELELADPDAFRKAIIYSEIIKRKY